MVRDHGDWDSGATAAGGSLVGTRPVPISDGVLQDAAVQMAQSPGDLVRIGAAGRAVRMIGGLDTARDACRRPGADASEKDAAASTRVAPAADGEVPSQGPRRRSATVWRDGATRAHLDQLAARRQVPAEVRANQVGPGRQGAEPVAATGIGHRHGAGRSERRHRHADQRPAEVVLDRSFDRTGEGPGHGGDPTVRRGRAYRPVWASAVPVAQTRLATSADPKIEARRVMSVLLIRCHGLAVGAGSRHPAVTG